MVILQESLKQRSLENIYKIIWISFSLISTLIGIKLNNMLITLALILFPPMIMFLIKVPKRLIYAEIIYLFVAKFMISINLIPNSANYVMDIINLIAFLVAIRTYVKRKENLNIKITFKIVIFMIIFSIVGLIQNGQSILLYLWGFRNIYRFFSFIFSCIVLLDKKDVENIFKVLNIFFIINILLCIYQYFILGLHQDNVGGIFGSSAGVNGYMNIYLAIMYTYALTNYLYKTKKFSYFITIAITSLFIVAISEIKLFFIEFILITIVGILLSNFNKRIFLLITISILGLYIAINILYTIYPDFKDFFNIDTMIKSSSEHGYSSKNELNRLTAISTIDEMFLTDNSKKLVGIGLGSAETSQIKTFNSKFFDTYGLALKYTWFSHAFMVLENGYIGLILYVGFFLAVFYENSKMKKTNDEKKIFTFVQIISLISILFIWYNSSLRTEAAYMWFFALSVGYIFNKKSQNNYKKI